MPEYEITRQTQATGRTFDGRPLVPGVNVDPVDVEAGLDWAHQLGYADEEYLVLNLALLRWRRGEEAGAEHSVVHHRGSTGGTISFTNWRMILAHAIARGSAHLTKPNVGPRHTTPHFSEEEDHAL